MLQAVVGDADQTHAECDGRIPSSVDDAIERLRGEMFQERASAPVDGLEVLEEQPGTCWSDCGDLFRSVAVARVRRVRSRRNSRAQSLPIQI